MNQGKTSVTQSLFWTFLEKIGSQGISFIISIVLARLIAPEAYGIIAVVHIFSSIATMFSTGGLSSALIKKKDADDLDYSSMFFYNLGFSCLIYAIMYVGAPWFVKILNSAYDYALLTKVLRIQSLSVFFASFNSFYRSRLEKNLAFKKTFFITLIGSVLSGAVGIYMAYAGYGVWALVMQSILSYFINSVTLVLFAKWIPKLQFSWKRLKSMLGYGYQLGASSLLTTIYLESNSLVIGNKYDPSTLAYYKKGTQFPKLVVANIISAINVVMFPAMAKMTTQEEYVASIKKINKMGSFLIAPMMFGFAAVAPRFIEVLLGEAWLPCVPFLQLACLDYALQPVGLSNLQYWKATGKATLYLCMDILKKVIGITLLVLAVTCSDSVLAILVCQILSTVIGLLISMIPQKKFLDYSARKQILDVLPQYLLSALMFCVVYALGIGLHGGISVLLLQIVVGAFFYLGLTKLFKLPELEMALSLVKSKCKKNQTGDA